MLRMPINSSSGFFKQHHEKQHYERGFSAVKAVGRAGVYQGYLANWFTPITNMLMDHTNPIAAADAIIRFHEGFKTRTTPPPHMNSLPGRQIMSMITTLACSFDPVSVVDAMMLIQKGVRPLHKELKSPLFTLFITHPNPTHFAIALVIMSQRGLLANEYAADNLTQTARFAENWFSEVRMQDKIINIPLEAFTQAHFDLLVEMSCAILPDRSNLHVVCSNIDRLLVSIQAEVIEQSTVDSTAEALSLLDLQPRVAAVAVDSTVTNTFKP